MPIHDEIPDSEDEALTSSPLEHVYEHHETVAATDVLGKLVDASCQAANEADDFTHAPSPTYETFKGTQTGASDDAELPNTHQTDTQPNTSTSANHVHRATDVAVTDEPAVQTEHDKGRVLPATASLDGNSIGEQELGTIDEAAVKQDVVTNEPQKQKEMAFINEPEKRRELEQTDANEEPVKQQDAETVEAHGQNQEIPAADEQITRSLDSGVQDVEMQELAVVGDKPAKSEDGDALHAAQEPIVNIVSEPAEDLPGDNLVSVTPAKSQEADRQQEGASSLQPHAAATSMESKLSPMETNSILPQTEQQPFTAETEVDVQQPTTATTDPPKRPLPEEPEVSVDMFEIPRKSTPPPTRPKTAQEITIAELQAQKSALIASLAALENVQELVAEDESSDLMCTFGITEPSDSDIMTAADKIVKRHIKLLHEYNEIKDVAQGLMGLIADSRGVRIVEVQEEFGVTSND